VLFSRCGLAAGKMTFGQGFGAGRCFAARSARTAYSHAVRIGRFRNPQGTILFRLRICGKTFACGAKKQTAKFV